MNERKDITEGEFISANEMMELERERLKSQDKRTDIAKLAIEKNDEADKRMYDFHMEKMNKETELKKQQFVIAKTLGYSFSAAFIIIALLFIMTFFGDNAQSKIAADLLKDLSKGLAGIGVFLLGKGVFKKLTLPNGD